MSKAKKKVRNKIKSKRGAQKRFKITGTGKVRFRRAYRAHINTKRSAKKTRASRANGVMADQDVKSVEQMMPHDV